MERSFCVFPSPPRGGEGEGAGGFDLEGGQTEGSAGGAAGQGSARFRILSFALGPQLGQCCGGHVRVAVELFAAGDLARVRDFAAREAAGPFATVGRIGADGLARMVVEGEHPAAAIEGDRVVETFGEARRDLVLFGAGHVGRALVLALAPLPFRVVWVDPRPDAFPGAVPGNVTLVRPADPVAVLDQVADGAFVLVMTHDHALDLAIVDAALHGTRFPHVGVIGSATKRARFENRLREVGHGPAAIARLICPIGATGPKSKLPAVIAAATAVELIVADERLKAVGERRSEPLLASVGGGRAS
ncbi:xanthine dehydrogenase accessory protein XdhC [Prosthecomicrobium hirschii]|uniref:xanthine dehydrogenase accessory protein XdhC n=1 Tax=Prosthecodimorpha hirschii TaxID=665126 RepID=UPI0009F9452D|nr:xanthine dehydrogenase accessory protein XdhC [Prosthecomicrobium hirschii]